LFLLLIRDRKKLLTVERAGKSLEKSELEMMNELPRDNSDRMIKLVGMLYDSAVSFMKSHSLKLSMPEGSVSRALVEGKSSCSLQLDKKIKDVPIAQSSTSLFDLDD